ncbi:Lpg1974 family pore-forming outer membrane protein [Bythopirellula polymerisocia]|uniref:Uncharacterized protein n=1 Tax=Bythopirellula polymerisocia TaxID=2528003 RepID=A0A5C6C8A9_9BACT|nr:Lpg1974 family pore-forming outer membrane protein [Bythopirellula polymerisocia]TWU20392.1 hypothetical protein Pla144_49670 [Bythopirellula polymerisocia]
MKFRFREVAALAVSFALLAGQTAQAANQREYQTANSAARQASDSLANYNEIEQVDYFGTCSAGSCSSGCSGGGNLGLGSALCCHDSQLFFYGDYIYARACFSEALAYIVSDPNDPQGGQSIVEYDMDYTSSYRFGGGINFCDCGGAIVFNFARYQSEGDFNVTDTSASTGTTIFGPYEVDAPGDNGSLRGNLDVDVKSYDLGVSKTIPLGCPMGCCSSGCCDSCCGDTCCDTCCGGGSSCGCGSGCGCCPCPAWDITWTAGVRFAEVDWARSNLALANNADQIDSATTTLNFNGAGARVGFIGRRYFGRSGCVSAYAKGDLSLLVGDMDISTYTTDDPDGTAPLTLRSYSNSGCRVIPVTEIEAGVSAQVSNNIQLSSGYFIAAWHDLGIRDEYDWTVPGLQLNNFDDANILGFDGFFARAVFSY